MIIKWCPWCSDRQKPEVIQDVNIETRRRTLIYKCKNCKKPWIMDSEGEPAKLESREVSE